MFCSGVATIIYFAIALHSILPTTFFLAFTGKGKSKGKVQPCTGTEDLYGCSSLS